MDNQIRPLEGEDIEMMEEQTILDNDDNFFNASLETDGVEICDGAEYE